MISPEELLSDISLSLTTMKMNGKFSDIKTAKKYINDLFDRADLAKNYQKQITEMNPKFNYDGFGQIYEDQILDCCLLLCIMSSLSMGKSLNDPVSFLNTVIFEKPGLINSIIH